MKDSSEEIIQIITNQTDLLIQLNLEEQKKILEYSTFVAWILGFVSAGFILSATNLKIIQDINSISQTKVIFSIVFILFALNLLSCIFYRLINYKLIGKHIMNSNYLITQKLLLIDNLNLIPSEDKRSNVRTLKISVKLSNFSYLDKDSKDQYISETDPSILAKINGLLFFLIIGTFIAKYFCIFLIFYNALME
jgi:hypothetical protein